MYKYQDAYPRILVVTSCDLRPIERFLERNARSPGLIGFRIGFPREPNAIFATIKKCADKRNTSVYQHGSHHSIHEHRRLSVPMGLGT